MRYFIVYLCIVAFTACASTPKPQSPMNPVTPFNPCMHEKMTVYTLSPDGNSYIASGPNGCKFLVPKP